ncbi:hypothetical protein Slala01_34660 [Streptomyces lavendulae subsp. lavendulae]|nr:hypothetical protein Slala01_34660 [Streptomyces lavendulae subsp. lavendulae]
MTPPQTHGALAGPPVVRERTTAAGRRARRQHRASEPEAGRTKENVMLVRKFNAAVIAAVAVASVAVVATPAEAGGCSRGGRAYICEYEPTTHPLPDGRKQDFIVGTDRAVWTRWTDSDGDWSKWMSMGGRASSKAYVYDYDTSDPWSFRLFYYDEKAEYWGRNRDHDGNWSSWIRYDLPLNG